MQDYVYQIQKHFYIESGHAEKNCLGHMYKEVIHIKGCLKKCYRWMYNIKMWKSLLHTALSQIYTLAFRKHTKNVHYACGAINSL